MSELTSTLIHAFAGRARQGAESVTAPIKKADDELQVVWGEVYAPGIPDSQGDFMTAETIREMAWGFMKKQALSKIDVQHCQQESGSYVVESFIAREGDPTFIAGAWVLGVKIPEPEIWQLVKSGDLNGFSIDGYGLRTLSKLELEIPEVLFGETDAALDGHKHGFSVRFGPDGEFLGGQTTEAEDGHWHPILKGTVTEVANGHSHRFSFIEGVINAQAAA